MSEQLLALLPVYGVPVIGFAVFLACCGIPLPTAVIMLFGGSLVSTGDLTFWAVYTVCVAAACSGDQVGYWAGRIGGTGYVERFAARGPKRQRLVDRARDYLERRGVIAIFITRWLLAMIGPYMNPVAGAAGMRWKLFIAAAIPGQMLYVLIYTLLGLVFSHNIIAVAQIVGNASGFLAAGVVTLALFWYMTRVLHFSWKRRRRRYLKPRGRRNRH
ncbi:DedA family protein [Martelella sp. AD-3]|uniref:DedA family protein n=1 Tax=Martelella sp. AD-3 TaxID=686597 RepID=UPI0004665F2C|nr:DedA family protein [Martelella sp. AD-3]AMM85486.1 hypothetical protein AZF01_14885 [Martelella sp. AD-3]